MTRGPDAADGGFSLIELVVAIGVFGALMVVISSATLAGFTAVRETTTRSQAQQDSQDAMIWITRLVRYIDTPEGAASAVVSASAGQLTAYSYSGTGAKNDAPYKFAIGTGTRADGRRYVYSDIWAPTKTASGWTWAATATRRTMFEIRTTTGTPLGIAYYACDPTTSCNATRHAVTPPVTPGALAIVAPQVLESVEVSVGDPAAPTSVITQSVKLVNAA
jgi:prepilin-type N-terminal cleavage/methylation domain-containing protein